MVKRVLAVLLVIGLAVCNGLLAQADETESGVGSTEYHMILDRVEGTNIESFYIERPDPEALKNQIVKASDFGLNVQNEDNFDAFQSALDYCKSHPNTYLVIDQGIYSFKKDATLYLNGLKNVLIEGNGAEFIFETQKQFVLNGCDGVEFHNLIIDWNWEEKRIASLVRVQNKTDHSFEIEFLELDDVDENITLASFQQYDSREYVPGNYGNYKTFTVSEVPDSVRSVEKIASNVLRIEFTSKFTTSFHNDEVYILRHYIYGGQVFNTYGSSRNITFDNVRIYGAAGMGFVFGGKSNHFQVINCYIGLRPGNEDKQRMSTTADGIHILNTDGYFRIDHCDMSYTGDDIINIHDDMMKVMELYSDKQVYGLVTGGFVQKGDKIRIYNPNIEDIGFETEVVSITRKNDTAILTLQDELPAEVTKGYLIYRSSSSTHNYVVSNNYIHETKGRAALLKASDALFENNRIYRTVSEGVEVAVDISENDTKIWYEGIGVSNVVIQNNTFEECAFGGKPTIVRVDCDWGTNNSVLTDVHIINNQFYACFGATITADNVSDLYIENNIISDCGEIKIGENVGAVVNSGNEIIYPSADCQHTDTKQVQDRRPGCFEYGSTGKTYCNQCHTIVDANYRGISPLAHKNLLVKRIDIAPTCTDSGWASMVCAECKTVVETDLVEPATGHSFIAETGAEHMCAGCGLVGAHDCEGADRTCSVCGYGKSVTVSGMSLALDMEKVEYIGINLYVDAPKGTVFYVDGSLTEAVETVDTGLLKIQLKCAPVELADKHILSATDSTNKAVAINGSTDFVYSGERYCKAVLAAESEYSEKLIAICSSLLEYSNQARNYFRYNNEGLVTGTVEANLPTEGYSMKLSGTLPSGCSYQASSLVLGDEPVLRHYFAGDSRRFTFSCTDITARTASSYTVCRTESENIFYVDLAVTYSNMGNMLELKANGGNGNLYTVRYGVITYCRIVQGQNHDSNLKNLCNALFNYSAAVASY